MLEFLVLHRNRGNVSFVSFKFDLAAAVVITPGTLYETLNMIAYQNYISVISVCRF